MQITARITIDIRSDSLQLVIFNVLSANKNLIYIIYVIFCKNIYYSMKVVGKEINYN